MSAMFTSNELCAAANITYRQLDHWIRDNIIAPANHTPACHVRPAHRHAQLTLPGTSTGSGYARLFSPDTVRIARILGQLRTAGVPLPILKNVAANLPHTPTHNATHLWITPDGHTHLHDPEHAHLAIRLDLNA